MHRRNLEGARIAGIGGDGVAGWSPLGYGPLGGSPFFAEGKDSPALPRPLSPVPPSSATLTVLTGIHAGQLVAIDAMPFTIGRAADVDLICDDAGVSHHHCRVARTADGTFYAEDFESTTGTRLGSRSIGVGLLHSGDPLRLGPNVELRFAVVEGAEDIARNLPSESPPRDVFNRRCFQDRLLLEVTRSPAIGGGEVAVLVIDVGRLSEVNECVDFRTRELALCTIAGRILRALPPGVVLARYAADKFAVLAVGTTRREAGDVAEVVFRSAERPHTIGRALGLGATACIGLAWLGETRDAEHPAATLLFLADARARQANTFGWRLICDDGVGPTQAAR